jgi:diamine N-acetyltransferase
MIIIQRAVHADALLLADIGRKTFIESHGHSAPAPDIDGYVSHKYNVRFIEEELNDAENIYHIIYYNGLAAGFSKIILNNPYPLIEAPAVTKLEKIYLLKEFHDLKLGLTLLEFVIGLSKQGNQMGMWLYVWLENERAFTFYRKNGFKIIGSAGFKISETHSNPNHVMYLQY